MQTAKYHHRFYSKLIQRIIDALIGGVTFYLAYQIRFEWQVPFADDYQMWFLVPAIMFGQVLVSSVLGVYRLVWRYVSLTDGFIIARSYIVFSTILLVLRLGLPERWWVFRVPRSIIVIQLLLSLTAALSARVLRRIIYERQSSKKLDGEDPRRVVLIGAGRAGVMVTKEISSRPDIKAVGFLDDDPQKIGAVINGLQVLGPVDSLPEVVKQHNVQEIIICIPQPPRATLRRLWALCEQLALRIKIVPTLEEILHGKVNITAFRGVETADLLGRDTVELSLNEPNVAGAYRGKRILITGAGGSIGSEVAQQLVRLMPEQLVLLDKDESGLNDAYLRIAGDSKGLAVQPVIADIRFSARLQTIFSRFRPEVVFHAAAYKHVPLMEMNPCEAILNNVTGTRNVVEHSVAFGVSRFVLISTDKAVKPISIMGASKRLCEMIVQAQRGYAHTRFSCVRFGNVLGSRGSVVPLFQQQIARGGPVTVTHPEVTRFLMTIPEAVRLVIQAGTLASSGEIFVLEMGEPVPILNLARDLIEHSGLRPGRDIQIEITGLRRGEKISEELIDGVTEQLSRTPFDKILVVKKKPIDLAEFAQKLSAVEEAARRESPQDIYRILRELNIGFYPEALNSNVLGKLNSEQARPSVEREP